MYLCTTPFWCKYLTTLVTFSITALASLSEKNFCLKSKDAFQKYIWVGRNKPNHVGLRLKNSCWLTLVSCLTARHPSSTQTQDTPDNHFKTHDIHMIYLMIFSSSYLWNSKQLPDYKTFKRHYLPLILEHVPQTDDVRMLAITQKYLNLLFTLPFWLVHYLHSILWPDGLQTWICVTISMCICINCLCTLYRSIPDLVDLWTQRLHTL